MIQEKTSDLLLVATFMEIDVVDINTYAPHKDWNELMKVCKKIINMYFDKRTEIFEGLQTCDIDKTYKAVVEFIKFWYDDTQEKLTWTNQVTPVAPATKVEVMKVTDAKIVDGNPRAKVRGGTYITFLSNENIAKDTYVDIVVENKTHHFEVSNVEIKGNLLSIDAREVGYWARKIEKKKDFDLRTLIGLDVTIVTDDAEKKQIYQESCWC